MGLTAQMLMQERVSLASNCELRRKKGIGA
jgi:hypothetical protein